MLHIATLNIHKGWSPLNRQLMIHELRTALHGLNPDILFLQEVQGAHAGHAARFGEIWPEAAQHQFLADSSWDTAYGKNLVYKNGHHGNAILSRFPILHSHNQDVTHWRVEKRGLLHCQLVTANGVQVHCVSGHFSLFARSRRWQFAALADYVDTHVPAQMPLIIAGDFNDWTNRAETQLGQRLGLTEIFSQHAARHTSGTGKPARSFPAIFPILRLDRIYVRGFEVLATERLHGKPWSDLTDHAALSARLLPHVA